MSRRIHVGAAGGEPGEHLGADAVHLSPPGVGSDAPTPVGGEPDRLQEPDWRVWMRELGRRQRRLREFLGLSQEQVARLAGVSQGAVSRLETARGLATPMLIVVKINTVLLHELRRLDSTLLSPELREAVELQAALIAPSGGLGFKDVQLADDPGIEELVRLYRETPERHRPGVLSVLRAMVGGFKSGASPRKGIADPPE